MLTSFGYLHEVEKVGKLHV